MLESSHGLCSHIEWLPGTFAALLSAGKPFVKYYRILRLRGVADA
jgi:hypothetical protein